FMEYYFLIALHTKSYDIAAGVMNKVAINFYFDKIPAIDRIRWNLYRSYLFFISGEENFLRNYDHAAYFEEIPEFNKERAGLNAAILILQFLNCLKQNRTEAAGRPLDEFARYLNQCPDSFSRRTKVLYKLLHCVVKHRFDLRVVRSK